MIAVAAAALLASFPVTAAPIAIRHADLDLTSPAGRAALDRRVARALESACGFYFQASPEETRRHALLAVRPAVAGAIARAQSTGAGSRIPLRWFGGAGLSTAPIDTGVPPHRRDFPLACGQRTMVRPAFTATGGQSVPTPHVATCPVRR